MKFGTVTSFNLKCSDTLHNMKGCGALVFTQSPLLPHSGYCFMDIRFSFSHVSWLQRTAVIIKLALTEGNLF